MFGSRHNNQNSGLINVGQFLTAENWLCSVGFIGQIDEAMMWNVLKVTAICDVAPCCLAKVYLRFIDAYCHHHQVACPHDGGSKHLWNVDQHPRWQSYSHWPLWEPQISQGRLFVKVTYNVATSTKAFYIFSVVLGWSVNRYHARVDPRPSWKQIMRFSPGDSAGTHPPVMLCYYYVAISSVLLRQRSGVTCRRTSCL